MVRVPTRVNIVANRGTAKLEGVAELRANLDALGNEVATKVGRAADRKAARAFAETLKLVAPHRPGVQLKRGSDYGNLRDNIRVRLARARKDYTITYNVDTGRAFWAFFLEYGTRNMPARPFMRPAFDAAARLLIEVQQAELRAGIERAAKRLKVSKK
jgi:HK97 gp10 family phage protein